MSTERPILFSAPMVRAILDGTKTQTRRIVKTAFVLEHCLFELTDAAIEVGGPDIKGRVKCPYGKPGDTLWVRETHFISDEEHEAVGGAILTSVEPKVYYKADDKDLRAWPGWRPSIHMPRWASRITLEVESVKVERLQAISQADAFAEGIPKACDNIAIDTYAALWQKINGPGSWEANPWVWVVTFRKITQPAP